VQRPLLGAVIVTVIVTVTVIMIMVVIVMMELGTTLQGRLPSFHNLRDVFVIVRTSLENKSLHLQTLGKLLAETKGDVGVTGDETRVEHGRSRCLGSRN